MNQKTDTKERKIIVLVFYVLLIVYTASNIVWLLQHDAPPISDSVYYISGSQTLIQNVQEKGLSGFSVVPDLVPFRPPLQSVFGSIALLVLGSEPDRVFFLNVIWLSGTVWIAFILISRLAGVYAGLCSSMFLISNPFLHGHLSMFETEVPMMMVVMSSFYAIHKLIETQKLHYAILLGLMLSAGMLLKWIFFLLLVCPVLLSIIWLVKLGETSKKSSPLWLILWIMLIPSVIALPWYVYQFDELIAYQSEVSLSNLYTPFDTNLTWESIWYYPKLLVLKLKWFHVFVVILCLSSVFIIRRDRSNKDKNWMLYTAGLSVLFYWIFFIANPVNLPQKYLLPLQPLIALFFGLLLPSSQIKCVKAVIILLSLLMGMLYLYQAWGIFSRHIPTYQGYHSSQWLEPQTGFFEYPKRPPRQFRLPHQAISEDIVQARQESESEVHVTTIPWLDRFNAFNISIWFNQKMNHVKSNGLNQFNILHVLLFHDFIITSNGLSHREKTHRDRVDSYRYDSTLHISNVIRSQPAWFTDSHQLLNSYTYKDRENMLQLYQRTQPVSPNEAQAVIGSLMEGLLPHDYLWDQLNVVWNRLNQPEHLNRAKKFRSAYGQNDTNSVEALSQNFKSNASSWFAYERYALYKLSQQTDVSLHSVWNAGPVLGWYPFKKNVMDQQEKIPFHAYSVIPYPREVISDYFPSEMNCVMGEFVQPGEKLLAAAPAPYVGDEISTTRLFSMYDMNFIDSHSVIRQFQPLEDNPNQNNQSKGVTLAAGDITNDGKDELLAGQTDSESSVTAFSVHDFGAGQDDTHKKSYVGFPPDFRGKGGVRLAVADLDGDGLQEIIAAANGNGFHLSVILPVILPVIENGRIQRFVRPQNSVVHVPPLDGWQHADPVYLTSGELDNNPANGDEILFGIDKPDTSYRILKINFERNAANELAEVHNIILIK